MNQNIDKSKVEEIEKELSRFTCTTQYYRPFFFLPYIYLTDGTKYLVERCNCLWLMADIAAYMESPKIEKHPELQSLQFWYLIVKENKTAELRCEWDEDKVVYKRKYSSTDFPLSHICLFVQKIRVEEKYQKEWLIHLSSEY
jgi:hypothetical protein